jgi:peptidoglycan hydrolase-like protein with peptidoglycan-binding domain
MKRLASWLRSALGVAGTATLVCSVGLSQTTPTTSTKPATHKNTVSASKTTPKKSAATAHSASAHPATKSKSAHSRTTSTRTSSHKGKRAKKVKGQQKIDSERTHQIQEALIRQHYMTGEATGKWDATTEDALRRFQADNGWQNKTVPDSRALIKLGLGPSHDHLLNPESAMTTSADAPQSTPASVPASTGPSTNANQPQR